jgi:hypothetical protein
MWDLLVGLMQRTRVEEGLLVTNDDLLDPASYTIAWFASLVNTPVY